MYVPLVGGDGKEDKRISCVTHGYYSSHSYCSHNRVGQHD